MIKEVGFYEIFVQFQKLKKIGHFKKIFEINGDNVCL